MVEWTYARPRWWDLVDSGCYRPDPDGLWSLSDIEAAIADALEDPTIPLQTLRARLENDHDTDWIDDQAYWAPYTTIEERTAFWLAVGGRR